MWEQLVEAIKTNNEKDILRLLQTKPEFVNATGSDGHNALHLAAMWGRDGVVQMLLEKHPQLIQQCGRDGYTALHLAAQGGHIKVVELLLSKMESSSIGWTGTNGYNALHLAATWGRDKVVQILAKAQPELVNAAIEDYPTQNVQDSYSGYNVRQRTIKREKVGYTAIHLAAEEGHDKVVALLLQTDPKLSHLVNKITGYTVLHIAAEKGQDKIVALLLQQIDKSLISQPSKYCGKAGCYGATAMHLAAENGHDKVVELLLKADPNLAIEPRYYYYRSDSNNGNYGYSNDTNHTTTLHLAAEKGHTKVVALLLQAKPELANACNTSGSTALHSAANSDKEQAGSERVTELLLERMKPESINAVAGRSYTALHYAAQKGNAKVFNLLLPHTKLELFNLYQEHMETILDMAAEGGNPEIVALLFEKISPDIIKKVRADKHIILLDLMAKGHTLLKKQNAHETQKLLAEASALRDRLANEAAAKDTQTKLVSDTKTKLQKLNKEKDDISTQLSALKEEKASLSSKIQQLNERLVQEQKEKSDQTKLMENMHAKLAQLMQEKERITAELTVLTQTKSVLETQLKPFLQKDREEKAKIAEETRFQDEQQKIKQAALLAKLQYPPERIKKLLEMQLQSEVAVKVEILDLQNGNATDQQVQNLLQLVLGQNKILAIALHLRGETWASLVIRKHGDDLQIIYNNPNGEAAAKNQSVSALTAAIASHYEDGSIISLDLKQVQQKLESDSAVFVVDNLVKLASAKIFKKAELQNLLSKSENIELLRKKHLLIEDDSKAYDEEKFAEILEIACKDKAMEIEPITRLEDVKQLTKNVKDAAEKVMQKGHPAILPLLSSGNWSGLVIKKHENDGVLQVLYIDPKGNKLATQPNAKILLSQILTVNPEVQIIDISKNQQTRDEDSGFLTIDNLVRLATSNTFGLNKTEISKITAEQNASQALRILYTKMFEQAIMGSEYQHDAWEDDQNAANNAPHMPEGGTAAQFVGGPPPYDDHAQEHVKLLGA